MANSPRPQAVTKSLYIEFAADLRRIATVTEVRFEGFETLSPGTSTVVDQP